MTSPKGARRAAGLLQRAIPAESDPGPSPEAREAAIAAVASALEARRRALRARRSRRLAALVAMAATVVLVMGFAVSRRAGAGAGEGPVAVGHGAGAAIRLADGSRVNGTGDIPLAVGSRVETPIDGSVHLAFPSGTELDLHEAGAVEVAETGSTQSFRLTRGALDAHVAKLAAGHRFLVRTPDAEVEVRGTRFRVSVGGATCAGAGATRVDVEEGLVVVRAGGAEAHVAAGESWPRCEAPAVTAAAPRSASAPPPSAVAAVVPSALSAPPGVEGPAPARSSAPPSASPSPPAHVNASSLAAQNALYEEALEQKRSGAPTAAVASLDRLLERYPSGPLAESASAERMRLLAKLGSPRAAGAAREYLRRYPRGFARATAEALAGRADP